MRYVGAIPPEYPGKLKKGDRGKEVKRLQEMLCFVGYELQLDSDFGDATEFALTEFQGLKISSYLKKQDWDKLIHPFKFALRELNPARNSTLEQLTVAYADRHLFAKAQELKRSNLGPWVRMYMKGHEGKEFPWCSGFVSFCIKQAAETLGFDVEYDNLPDTFSCDNLAEKWGLEKNQLETNPVTVEGGSIFLIHQSKQDWIHTGFVLKQKGDSILTIEGNTNVKGERDGIAIMRRVRKMSDKIDIISSYGV